MAYTWPILTQLADAVASALITLLTAMSSDHVSCNKERGKRDKKTIFPLVKHKFMSWNTFRYT